ncbi:MAG TPA: molybdenum ABC transporter ATP-binding protein [Blastocatellia bacterium]|nr:molybdenum ABC transporter ATP-binding protein [Blastocatellia bacterium]
MTLSVRIKKALRTSGSRASARGGEERGAAAQGFSLDVEFDVPPGFTILFGASGSGKTTTLKSISGIVSPDSGRIAIGDEVLFDSSEQKDLPIRKRGVGYVFQDLALFPHLTARANVEFGMTRLSRADRRRKAEAMMEALRISHTAARKPREVSGGEAQRVALARALAHQPRILLLDEPLSAIDEATKRGIIADLKSINRELRLPIIYVTHSRQEAVSLGERVIVYEQGRVVASGEPISVFGTPVTASVARLTGVENIFSAKVIGKSEEAGIMTVEVSDAEGSCRVDVPFGNESLGERVTLAVPSGDILLATEEPRSTSLRNRMRGTITAIDDDLNRTIVRVNAGVIWSASVTRQAVSELGLSRNQEVWLAFKTHSCYLLDRSA